MAFGASTAPSTAAKAPGSVGIRLLDVPVNEANDPRARLYIVDHVEPGTMVQRQIEVSNTTSSDLSVALYAAAATIDGTAFIGDAAHTANDLSSWTSVTPAAPQLAAGGTATATVTINVPADAPVGEQYAIVWAEVRSSAGGGVTEVNRVGIRIYLSVGTGTAPVENFTISSLTAQRSAQGNPVVVAAVRNTGGVALDMSGTLQLSAGPGGLSAGPFPATLGVTLAIGATEPVSVTLNGVVPAGPWLALITLRSGLTQRSAQATITFPASTSPAGGASAAVIAVSTHRRSDAANIVTIAVIASAIAVAGIAVLRRRPRARRWFT